jgi:hypothetical protein
LGIKVKFKNVVMKSKTTTKFILILLIGVITNCNAPNLEIDKLTEDVTQREFAILSAQRFARTMREAAQTTGESSKNSFNPNLTIDKYISQLPKKEQSIAENFLNSKEYSQFQNIFNNNRANLRTKSETSILEIMNEIDLAPNIKDELINLSIALANSSSEYSNSIDVNGSDYNGAILTSQLRNQVAIFENSVLNKSYLTTNEKSIIFNISTAIFESMDSYVSSSEAMLEALYPYSEARCRFLCKLVTFIGAVVFSVALVAIVGAAIAVPIAMIVGPAALVVGAAVGGAYALYDAVVNNTCYSIQTSTGYGTSLECVQW